MEDLNKALFLDRDGIFNELVFRAGQWTAPWNWQEVKIIQEPNVFEQVKSKGYLLILITNQPDIEKGFTTLQFVEQYHEVLRKQFFLDAVYYCASSNNNHSHKKPNPGMLFEAAKDYKLNLQKSFFIGDTENDVLAAKNAQVKSVLLDKSYNKDVLSDYHVEDISELLTLL